MRFQPSLPCSQRQAHKSAATALIARRGVVPLWSGSVVPSVVEMLPYDELAVALGASDLPTSGDKPSVEELAAFVRQGFDRLGGDEVWQRALLTRLHMLADGKAAWLPLWGSARRLRRCHDMASRFQTARSRAGLPVYMPVMIEFERWDEQERAWVAFRVDARDLAFASRLDPQEAGGDGPLSFLSYCATLCAE